MATKAEEELAETKAMVVAKEAALREERKENKELKTSMNPLGMAGLGAVAVGTAGALGLAEGYRTGADPAKKDNYKGVAEVSTVIVGSVGAAVAGAENPTARAAAAGVAIGAACQLAGRMGFEEGAAMALEKEKKRLKELAAAGKLPPGTAPPTNGK